MTAVLSAASWSPQNRKFFRLRTRGLNAFSTALSKLFDNYAYPNFNFIQTFPANNFKTAV
jgi:hypothetical protein